MTALVVNGIEGAGHRGRARRLLLDDGERLVSPDVVKELDITIGVHVDVHALEAAEERLAKQRALRILAARERSRSDVHERLTAQGYPSEVAQRVCDRFEELSLIDDDRFARAVTRSRSLGGYGPRRILDELKRHGIDDAVAQVALSEEAADSSAEIVALVQRFSPSSPAERERVLRRLVRRGFSFREVLAALESFEQDPR